MKYLLVCILATVAWTYRDDIQLKVDRITYEWRAGRESIQILEDAWNR